MQSEKTALIRSKSRIFNKNNNRMAITIILTSTVNVKPNVLRLFQTDKVGRAEIYVKSILQWLNNTRFNIVLVENSGYTYEELNAEKTNFRNRFEVISFNETELEEARYLKNNIYKGASEIFAINYAFNNSKLIHKSNFIIKITARYYIDDLENYLSDFDMDKYDCLTQTERDRCEMIGCHYKKFAYIFDPHLINDRHLYEGHVEEIYEERTRKCKNVLICKKFKIAGTQRGGINELYDNI